ncbi:uncharacterized protein LOC126565871 [Anopheles maculipalpis]|uniref:uncharacterized protein LOC126565871 n=1 Tax=Anopheles maculipalpis TaxID=1496333 RepID=UPI002158C1C8|nr:uncharacterized protein LOC126565871 [Anopheles maculipalpis]
MSIMCTIVSIVLACSLLLVSIAFIGASSRHFGEQTQKREANNPAGVWELVSAATVAPKTPVDLMMRFDGYNRNTKPQPTDEEDPLEAENSHVVVQVYSVDSDQEVVNDSASMAIRTLKVENFVTPKEHMDGKSTDRVERKVLAPGKNVPVESGEKEDLLSEQFFIDESGTEQEPNTAVRRPGYGKTFGNGRAEVESYDQEQERVAAKGSQSSYANSAPPFFDYNEQTSQRMLDEFFALRNQDTLASRRSNYDWGEGQLRSRTLEDIKNQNRASAASRRKAQVPDYPREDDMSYDRYADYAEAEQRAVGYTAQKLGRKQRATPSTGGQTHVLNKVPIVAYDGDGSMAPMYKTDPSQRSQFERSRFHYSLPSMVYNPYAWDPYHMNMLRFPQCNACQQNARALCSKCGLCADCCAHSKCTCGCLNG